MHKSRIAIISAALLLVASSAFAYEKGQTLLGLEVGGGQASWLGPASTGYVTTQPSLPTLRAGAELWYFMSGDCALAISGGIDHFSETDKPGTAAPLGAVDQKSTISGFHVRVGSDHVFPLADKAHLFMGGGLFYGTSKFKYEAGTTSDESPSLTTYGIDGRIGATCDIAKNVAMGGRIGHNFGIASGDQDGAKASATASAWYGEVTLIFAFGGK